MKRLIPPTTQPVLEGDSLSRAWFDALERTEFRETETIIAADAAGTAPVPANAARFLVIRVDGEDLLIPAFRRVP